MTSIAINLAPAVRMILLLKVHNESLILYSIHTKLKQQLPIAIDYSQLLELLTEKGTESDVQLRFASA